MTHAKLFDTTVIWPDGPCGNAGAGACAPKRTPTATWAEG